MCNYFQDIGQVPPFPIRYKIHLSDFRLNKNKNNDFIYSIASTFLLNVNFVTLRSLQSHIFCQNLEQNQKITTT